MTNKGRPSSIGERRVDIHVLDRLENILREEIGALKNHEFDQLAHFTNRKALCLLEMTRGLQGEVPHDMRAALAQRLDGVRRDLAADQSLISLHLRAAGDVALLLARAASKVNEDGTYSPISVRTTAPQPVPPP